MNAGKKPKKYFAGNTFAGRRIVRIEPDGVVVEANGVEETIFLRTPEKAAALQPSSRAPVPPASAPRGALRTRRPAAVPPAGRRSQPQRVPVRAAPSDVRSPTGTIHPGGDWQRGGAPPAENNRLDGDGLSW